MATKKAGSKKPSSGSDPKSKRIVRKKMAKTMDEFKHHQLKSGPGGKAGTVKNPKQAIAIGLSEARKAGADIPPAPSKSRTAKKTSAKKTSAKKTSAKKSTSKRPTSKKKAR
ncbi:MAG TPA: DUF6496 domain-containing protein [Bryobacteraceae bacterium]|nr:DUF6496 domain-containing protein [Bryobacteraceae bacterium]